VKEEPDHMTHSMLHDLKQLRSGQTERLSPIRNSEPKKETTKKSSPRKEKKTSSVSFHHKETIVTGTNEAE